MRASTSFEAWVDPVASAFLDGLFPHDGRKDAADRGKWYLRRRKPNVSTSMTDAKIEFFRMVSARRS
jgi:hypothetical protein